MSYILDALKKAEAERRGGQYAAGPIPPSFHVHAQRPPVWRRPWLWSVLSAAAVVAGGLIWMSRGTGTQPAEPQPPAQASQQAQPAAPAAPAAPTAAAPAIPPVAQAPAAPAPAPAVQPPSTPAPAPTPPAAQAPAKAPEQAVEKPKATERKPAERKAPEAAAKASKKPQQEEEKVAAAPATSPAPADKPKPAPEPQVGTLRDLPVQIQQEVPQYSVGGYIYSGNKADRSVVINKRLLREGDEIAPGLTLERMTPTGMVLNYKGYRYRASY